MRHRPMAERTRELARPAAGHLPDLDAAVALMSGGQRQAVAVARAVAFSSKLVILDEPTAALGLRESARVLDLIRRLKDDGVAVILISHSMDHVMAVADRALVLRRGRAVGETGAHRREPRTARGLDRRRGRGPRRLTTPRRTRRASKGVRREFQQDHDRGCRCPVAGPRSMRGQQRRPSSASAAALRRVAAGAAVKVAFVTKFQVEFFTAMEDAAKSYAAQNSGIEISYFSCKTPSDVACQTAQIEDAVARKFQAIVITPMGPEVIPAMTAAADKGLKVVLVDNNLDDFTKKTAVAATDNVKGGQAAGAYLKSVLKPGDSIGLMEGVRGVPALDARIQGVKDALTSTGVKVIIGGAETKCDAAQGATVAEDLLTREPNLTAIYSACDDPAIAAAKVAKEKGKPLMVMGYDGLPDAAKAIEAGDMRATIAQFPGKMATLGVAGRGERGAAARRSSRSSTPAPRLVTKDNAAQFTTFQ